MQENDRLDANPGATRMSAILCSVCKERPANYGAVAVSSYLDADTNEKFEVIES